MANWPRATTQAPVERRDIDQRGRVVALGVGERIGENQSSFGIGILNFNCFTR